MSRKKAPTISSDTAERYEYLTPLLESMYAEFKELTKRKHDAALSDNKIKIVNRLLEQISIVLSDEPTKDFLDLIDKDAIPQNSDVLIMLGQYKTALEQFFEKYRHYDRIDHEHKWNIPKR